MISFEKIKLVIWDLDETFWEGTLSEENVTIPEEHRELIIRLTDVGIVNSICSKNDIDPVRDKLQYHELWEYFVFPSINWNAKGGRVAQLIKDMQLRNENVLFIDDNVSNREEVKFFCPGIMIAEPNEIPYLINESKSDNLKEDLQHKRLNQYKVLEEKHIERAQYSSNEAFLMESNISVEVMTDSMKEIDRIHELIMRSNQLNFTKNRAAKEELCAMIDDPEVQSGYVKVTDNFGDYGIVGFYLIKEEQLVHFTFSCRTLGMGIEQYVYNLLKRPKLNIVGEVVSDLSSTELPKWINQNKPVSSTAKMKINKLEEHMVLIKGPCDLFQIYPYIANSEIFDTEFTYVTDQGLTVESTGHTTNIVEANRLKAGQKELLIKEVPFIDAGMFNNNIFQRPYKVVFISVLTDANLGIYRRKETGEKFAFLEYIHPITDEKWWPYYIDGTFNCAGFHFTEEILREFSRKYEFVGRNTQKEIVDNLWYVRKHLPADCLLVVMLGGELQYEKNTFEAYKDRHIVHKQINDEIRDFASSVEGVELLDVNKHLVDQSSFYDHFNHYIKPVYYEMAKEMVDIVNRQTGKQIKETSRLKMVQIRLKEMLAPIYYKLTKRKTI